MKKRLVTCFLFLFVLFFSYPKIVMAKTSCDVINDEVDNYYNLEEKIEELNCNSSSNYDNLSTCQRYKYEKTDSLQKLFSYYNEGNDCNSESLKSIIDDNDDICSNSLASGIKEFSNSLMTFFYIVAPFLLILFVSLDLVKIVASTGPDDIKKAKSNIFKRATAFILIFLIPAFVNIILNIASSTRISFSDNNYVCATDINVTLSKKKYKYLFRSYELSGVFIRPVTVATVTDEYGWRICPFHGKEIHNGIDISGNDRDIYSIGTGVVYKTGKNSSLGNYIVIDHKVNDEEYSSIYMHIADGGIYVSAGDEVTADTKIAKMGTTGNSTGIHLHLSITKGLYERGGDYIDPRELIDFPETKSVYWFDRVTLFTKKANEVVTKTESTTVPEVVQIDVTPTGAVPYDGTGVSKIVRAAINYHDRIRTEGWKYDYGKTGCGYRGCELKYIDDGGIEAQINNPSKYTQCAAFVSSVLYLSGVASDINVVKYNGPGQIAIYCETVHPELWKKITNVNELQAGDIFITADKGHVEIFGGYYNGLASCIGAGSDTAIQAPSPRLCGSPTGNTDIEKGIFAPGYFGAAYRYIGN